MDIHISASNPKRRLETLSFGQYTRSRHYVWSVPDDYDGVVVYLRRPSDSAMYFKAEAALLPSGVWRFDVSGGQCPDVGSSTYEVFGVRDGSQELLGRGTYESTQVVADARTADPEPVPPPPAQIYEADGTAHVITAVPDGMGGFTSIVE